ncbi:MAG: ArnT family glycosyltransferase [Promethearchaeota archaeon]
MSLVDRKCHLLIIVILIIGVIIRSLTLLRSIGGDEAAFLYYGWMIIKGKVLYRDLFNQKAPGVYFVTALFFLIFGKNVLGMRVLSILLNAFTAFVLFKIGKKISNPITGVISALLYEFDPLSLYYSTMVYSETFMVFFMVLAVYFYISAREKTSSWHYLFVGVLIGVSAIMRQPGIILILVIFVHQIYWKRTLKNLLQSIGTLILGTGISAIPIAVYFLAANALNDAVYATILFNVSTYSYGLSLGNRLKILYNQVFLRNVILWIVGVGGMLFTLERRKKWDLFLVGWCLASFLVVVVLSTPYSHYYIQAMPAFSLLGGIFIEKFVEISNMRMDGNLRGTSFPDVTKWLLASLMLFGLLIFGINYFLDARHSYGLLCQIEAAEYIKTHTSSDEIIFAPDSAYYLLTDRENKYRIEHLAVGHIEAFGIGDLPQYLETEHVRYIIMDPGDISWNFNEETYRSEYKDEVRAAEVKIVYEWILESYELEVSFASSSAEVYIYHSRFW